MARTKVTIDNATDEDIDYVVDNMRAADWNEISASAPVEHDVSGYIRSSFKSCSAKFIARYNGAPVALGGVRFDRTNVVTMGMIATDDFPKVGTAVTRFVKKFLIPQLEANGVHRIVAVSIADYTQSAAWLEVLGFKREATLRHYGRNKEDFIAFVRLRDADTSCDSI